MFRICTKISPNSSKIDSKKTKLNPSSKSLLNLATAKLDIMNNAVTGMLKIDIKFFNRVAKSKDEKTQIHLNELAVDINDILEDIKTNINKLMIT